MRATRSTVILGGAVIAFGALAAGCNLISGLSNLTVSDTTSSGTTSGTGATGGTGTTGGTGGTGATGATGGTGTTGGTGGTTTGTGGCDDGMMDGQETDSDCGGPDCKPCDLGRKCSAATDCASAICRTTCIGVSRLTAGNAHACALLSNGELLCWGSNNHGQLGIGSNVDSAAPVKVGLDNVADIAAGGLPETKNVGHTCARLSDGSVLCWGANDSGQLGDGTKNDAQSPSATPVLMNAKAVSVGGTFSCAIKSDDSVACWGYDEHNELGDGGGQPQISPVDAQGLPAGGVTAIATGTRHVCVISGGGLYCWGNNANGQLANAVLGDSAKIQMVDGLAGLTRAGAGYDFTCAFDSTDLRCWGDNSDTELSSAVAMGLTSQPTKLALPALVSFALGTDGDMDSGNFAVGGHACAVTAEGKVLCWGSNRRGQLGRGMVSEKDSTPTEISGLTGVLEVVAGAQFTCARMKSGAALCWGRNDLGQLGGGTVTASQSSPVPIAWP